jgi:hypothetical protein
MMTAWGCRDDEGRKKAGKIQDPRLRCKMQDCRTALPPMANGCASMLGGRAWMEGMEGWRAGAGFG